MRRRFGNRRTASRRAAPRLVASGVAGCLTACLLVTCSGVGEASQAGSGWSGHGTRSAVTLQGRDGIEARWVIAENKKPGTTAWRIPATDQPAAISGFANTDDAVPGQEVTFRVTTSSPDFTVVAYRMGWYGGRGARAVWTSTPLLGTSQPACAFLAGVNLVSCANWSPSFSVRIGRAFVPGDYLFKLTTSNGEQSYVPLTVSDPRSTATYLLINRTFTEQGWNTWGGYDFYQGLGACKPTYPVCNRARAVSYDRPFASGDGASDFLGNEYPLIELMERDGLDVGYVTDTALDAAPKLELGHRVLLSLGHDETWSTPERQGLDAAKAMGTNIVFLGAAAVLRHVRMEPSFIGPERVEVDYRNAEEDPLNGKGNPLDVTGNTFANPPTDWSEVPLTGEEYAGYLNGTANVPFVVSDPSSFVFAGTRLKAGDRLSGVVMSDFDHLDIAGGSPKNVEVLGHSPIPIALAYSNQGAWSGLTYADMTYYTDPKGGGGVIDTGTVNWIYSLFHSAPGLATCQSATVQAITTNILRVFGRGPAAARHPSKPDGLAVQPPGS